ncbi:MAG: RcpC/CpaB family pilus assembly protein [Solirubrobacteraceae bacterium]
MNRPDIARLSPGRRRPGRGDGPPKLRLRERPEAPPSETGEPPATRRLRSPLLLTGIVLVLIALIGYWAVYSASTRRTPILVTTHALPVGTVLSSGDLRTAQLAGDSSVLASLVPAQDRGQTIGRRLTAPLPAGIPVPNTALTSTQAQSSAMTLAVPEFDVIGTGVQAGSTVTILATFGAGSGQATTRPIARDLQVLSVGEAPSNADPSTATVPVTVSVSDSAIAPSLALANQDAKLDLLLEGSKPSTTPIPQARTP